VKRILWLLCAPAFAHVVSLSYGDFDLQGAVATFQLRLPVYEVQHLADREQTLLAALRFTGGGGEARLLEHQCAERGGELVCRARYLFNADVDTLTVQCRLAAAVVPNHVHLFRATNRGRADQAFFDAAFTRAELTFRPPTWMDRWGRDIGHGFVRALVSLAPILFLAALLVTTPTRGAFVRLAWLYLAGELAGYLLGPVIGPRLQPRFVEAAVALSVAYVTAEWLLLPKAGARWAVTLVWAVAHGLYFSIYLDVEWQQQAAFGSGVLAAELLGALILAAVAPLLAHRARRLLAWTLLFAGTSWFALRLLSR
jgi:hypothetical protein